MESVPSARGMAAFIGTICIDQLLHPRPGGLSDRYGSFQENLHEWDQFLYQRPGVGEIEV